MLDTVVTIVSSFGFPIAACCAMGWYINMTTQKFQEQIMTITEQHKSEMLSVTNALNNNTLALQKLCDKLEK